MPHRRIIIGDVHGHYHSLLKLLEVLNFTDEDRPYFLGDLIDRGPNSAQVVEFVKQHRYPCLMGNHEQMLLEAIGYGKIASNLLQSWIYSGGYATLESYNSQIPQDHIDWIKALPNYIDLGDVWLVHAGLNPQMPLDEQTSAEFCWIRDDFHRSDYPYFEDKLIITGHTITFTFPGVKPGQLVAGAGWLDIDTGAYHPNSGWLTALDIDNRLVYQVHTKSKKSRTLSLDEATVNIKPELVTAKRSKRSQSV